MTYTQANYDADMASEDVNRRRMAPWHAGYMNGAARAHADVVTELSARGASSAIIAILTVPAEKFVDTGDLMGDDAGYFIGGMDHGKAAERNRLAKLFATDVLPLMGDRQKVYDLARSLKLYLHSQFLDPIIIPVVGVGKKASAKQARVDRVKADWQGYGQPLPDYCFVTGEIGPIGSTVSGQPSPESRRKAEREQATKRNAKRQREAKTAVAGALRMMDDVRERIGR